MQEARSDARLENYKRVSRSGLSNTASNVRKEPFNACRDGISIAFGGDRMKSRGSRTLPYPEYVKKRERKAVVKKRERKAVVFIAEDLIVTNINVRTRI